MTQERDITTDDEARVELLDLAAAITAGGSGAILARESEDLDLNLVQFTAGGGVGAHINREVDVVLVALAGSGVVRIGNDEFQVEAGNALLIPKRTERAIHSRDDGAFAYLTIHRRRARLMPVPRQTGRAAPGRRESS